MYINLKRYHTFLKLVKFVPARPRLSIANSAVGPGVGTLYEISDIIKGREAGICLGKQVTKSFKSDPRFAKYSNMQRNGSVKQSNTALSPSATHPPSNTRIRRVDARDIVLGD